GQVGEGDVGGEVQRAEPAHAQRAWPDCRGPGVEGVRSVIEAEDAGAVGLEGAGAAARVAAGDAQSERPGRHPDEAGVVQGNVVEGCGPRVVRLADGAVVVELR